MKSLKVVALRPFGKTSTFAILHPGVVIMYKAGGYLLNA